MAKVKNMLDDLTGQTVARERAQMVQGMLKHFLTVIDLERTVLLCSFI